MRLLYSEKAMEGLIAETPHSPVWDTELCVYVRTRLDEKELAASARGTCARDLGVMAQICRPNYRSVQRDSVVYKFVVIRSYETFTHLPQMQTLVNVFILDVHSSCIPHAPQVPTSSLNQQRQARDIHQISLHLARG
jgi:hypothetical protein